VSTPRSQLPQAVRQLAKLANLWADSLVDLAEHQAGRLSDGDYDVDDLVAGQVGLLRLSVHNVVQTVLALPGTLTMLAYTGPIGPAHTRAVLVRVPGTFSNAAQLTVSDLVDDQSGFRIPAAQLELSLPSMPANAAAGVTTVAVGVTNAAAPNGIYRSRINAADGAMSRSFMIALSEVGTPLT
jgi:hypothetical protein